MLARIIKHLFGPKPETPAERLERARQAREAFFAEHRKAIEAKDSRRQHETWARFNQATTEVMRLEMQS